MRTLLADLHYAIRLLRRAPGFTLAVVVVLALGIGVNAAFFTALDKIVIRPLPYSGADQLAVLWEDFSAFGTPKQRVAPATFLEWKQRNHLFTQMGAYGGSSMDLSGGGPPEQVQGLRITSNLFPLLGAAPLLGRGFSNEEERPDARVVVLSHRLWKRRFGGDANLLGSLILMSGEKYTVIGIMPPAFYFPGSQIEYWVPLGFSPEMSKRRTSHVLNVVGRVKTGREFAQAQADMTVIAQQISKESPASNKDVGIKVVPLKDEVLGNSRNIFAVLLAAAACVLLIACANVANLLLARASNRQREIAVRTALGAAPGRLVRQILTENLVLACAGGALGLLFAQWSMIFLQKLVPASLAGSVVLQVDLGVFGFDALMSVITGLVFGLIPALQLIRSDVYTAGSSSRTTVSHRGRLRNVLVIAEVAIALVLVIGATLLIKTMARMRAVDPGFRSGSILTAEIDAPPSKYRNTAAWHDFYSDVLTRVKNIPGVLSVGLTSDLPYTSHGNTMSVRIENVVLQPSLGQDVLFRLVSAGYLETLGAKLIAGRVLEPRDNEASLPVVVVNDALVRQYLDNGNPLGRRIDTGTGGGSPRWMTIVGVVADIRERGLDLGNKPAVYVPFRQAAITFFAPSEIAVRTSRPPSSLLRELQQAVWSVDAEQPLANIRTMDAIVDDELSDRTQVLELLGTFAAMALVLAALGIYGVLSYVVSLRKREIALRMAIGASHTDIMRAILGYSARLTLAGVGAGIAGGIAATRLLATLLYGVSPLDPSVFFGVTGLLLVVAFVATYIPTRRAASVDPAITLREE